MFAGSCIGIILLVMSLEALRRMQRTYEKSILRKQRDEDIEEAKALPAIALANDFPLDLIPRPHRLQEPKAKPRIRDLLEQQIIRALLHTLAFAVAYFVMLLAMYYNGYFIICIFVGAFLGSFAFSWDQLYAQ